MIAWIIGVPCVAFLCGYAAFYRFRCDDLSKQIARTIEIEREREGRWAITVDTLTDQVIRKEAELKELRDQLASKSAEIMSLKYEIERLRGEREGRLALIDTLTEQVSHKDAELKELREQYAQSLAANLTEIASLKYEIETMKKPARPPRFTRFGPYRQALERLHE